MRELRFRTRRWPAYLRLRIRRTLTVAGLCLLMLSFAWLTGPLGHASAVSPAGSAVTLATTTSSASVTVGAFSTATPVPSSFWGVDVAALQRFSSTDAGYVAKTPTTFIRYPGGVLGEELNYTSGVVTASNGAQSKVPTTVAEFVASCKLIHCQAIFQLPAEINSPSTAAYFASYVVHQLTYQPAYWEIGNAPSGYKHFGQPWSKWSQGDTGNVTPQPFANLVHTYIAAILRVDPAGHFIALGAGEAGNNYAKAWVVSLVKTDGAQLSGISVHSYILGGPSHPSAAQLLANLRGFYSLPAQYTADAGYIHQACGCSRIGVFVTEINAAEVGSYTTLLPTFAGTLYLAAEVTQGLALRAPNLDWFSYDSSYPGAWSQSPGHFQMQYYLFADLATHFESKYLPSKVVGPTTFYAVVTYGVKGLAVFLVNTNTSGSLTVNLSQAGIKSGAAVTDFSWNGKTLQPSSSNAAMKSTVTIGPESILLIVAPPTSVV